MIAFNFQVVTSMKTYAPPQPLYRWVLKREGRLCQKWREYKTRRTIDCLRDHILQDTGWPFVEHDCMPDGTEFRYPRVVFLRANAPLLITDIREPIEIPRPARLRKEAGALFDHFELERYSGLVGGFSRDDLIDVETFQDLPDRL